MKIKEGFKLRNICDTNVIVAQGLENINFSKIINLNDSAAWLWQQVESREFSVELLASLLMEHYEVDEDTARQDAKDLVDSWLEAGIVSE
ncbi:MULTISPECIES: PqqD family protein [unclassified Bacteroides]|jgi:hypothetical protein|uniref:PqqD family protein n=1 Tax=unclassified Bacteroides TaxID=2646097 RepID=UPI000E84E5D4|nr:MULTISPECIES: PqqD family protein [unclassified Bacteroides]RGN50293.1 PqqD family protein [Bacteroides sp. OM05-12]RHR75952.1 PqqD family protein [Bacteroides sp. AF16-49]